MVNDCCHGVEIPQPQDQGIQVRATDQHNNSTSMFVDNSTYLQV